MNAPSFSPAALKLDDAAINAVLNKARSGGADFAEIFFEDTFKATVALNDSRIKQALSGRNFGIGIRAIYGKNARYAYTNSADLKDLLETASAVAFGGAAPAAPLAIAFNHQTAQQSHDILALAHDVRKDEKTEVLHRVDDTARSVDGRISQVDAGVLETIQDIWICNSEGLSIGDRRVYSRLYVSAIAGSGSEKQTAFFGPGGFGGYEYIRALDIDKIAGDCARSALTMLDAPYAPGGEFPVIIDNGFGGVIFHEACGHALETTAIAKNASVFCGKIGQKIAHESVTAIDDGTMKNEWGSLNIDDEGMPTQRTVLIENGILKSYLVDRLGSIQTGYARTGSGRRQGYMFAPTSRMRNTFIAPGPYTRDDLIKSVKKGIYAKLMGGGSVQPGTGDFNFAVAEGYMIRDGKICEGIRGATLIGNGAETLMKISMCAGNFRQAQGMCGSISGSIPTNVGQGAIRVDSIMVGGR